MPALDDSLKKHLIFLFVLSAALSFFTAQNQHMNNFLIFKHSFFHLMEGLNMFILHPEDHHDLYKYSPMFALFMGTIAWLPDTLGAMAWNAIGAGLFALALIKLPVDNTTKKVAFWICLPEFIGSTQGFQSNIHTVALILLFWLYLEEKRPFLAALCVLSAIYIKFFGLVALVLLLFSKYSWKDWKFFGRFSVWFVVTALVMAFLPAIANGWDSLMLQYKGWGELLKQDSAVSYGFSFMGVVRELLGADVNIFYFQVLGGLFMTAFFFIHRNGEQSVRLLALIAVCYFLVVFNHKSESPTFIIPMIAFGVHQSFFANKHLRRGLIFFTLLMVSVFYSDLFSRDFKHQIANVYSFKILPFLALLPLAYYQMFKNAFKGGSR